MSNRDLEIMANERLQAEVVALRRRLVLAEWLAEAAKAVSRRAVWWRYDPTIEMYECCYCYRAAPALIGISHDDNCEFGVLYRALAAWQGKEIE